MVEGVQQGPVLVGTFFRDTQPPHIAVIGQPILYVSDFSPKLWLHPKFGLGKGVQ